MSGQTVTVKMFRGDNTSWGFRLQGGKDFSAPLSVQRVNPGSLAEQAGLMTGDAIIKIHGQNADAMRHKEAQDNIIKAGNNLEMIVQRGGVRVWKPTVTPINDLPAVNSPQPSGGLYTKTSLAAKKQESTPIGTKHNVSPRPFAPLGGGKMLVNNQYNTPAPLYSVNNIADTLSAHTEVLATGAKGINFMKEPQPVNKDSAVYRMIMEEKQGGGGGGGPMDGFNHVEIPSGQGVTKHVSAPITKPPSMNADKPAGPNTCPECLKTIVGVFVRIKDKNLHPECFKCSTCGSSLKNVGYFNVNDKLYCDAHAKLAAKISASAPVYEPVSLSQLGEVPPIATSPTPQTPQIPPPMSPSTFRSVSPVPFHRPGDMHHVEAPQSPQPITSPPVFKPNAAPSFPSAAPAAPFRMPEAPRAPVAPPPPPMTNTSITPGTGGPGHKFVWPPQKNAPSTEAVLPSNSTPALPSYRPPPGTQHAASVPKYTSPTSPVPKPASPIPKPTFAPASLAPKAPPVTCPKPRTAVQSNKAQSWNTSSSSMTTTTTSTSSDMQSGVAFNAGPGARPAPKRGRGQMKPQVATGARIPICNMCGTPIRGPFVVALAKSWCPDHFTCANNRCQTSLVNIGFVEDRGQLYCENCYEVHLAPSCSKCGMRIKGDCLNALDKQWHPNCFVCCYCGKPFGNSSFYMEDGLPYCEKDWNELFTTKCVGCGFPIEAGDRWVEALNNNYHSNCFKCTKCLKGLEGQSFYAKGGKPYCKVHSRE